MRRIMVILSVLFVLVAGTAFAQGVGPRDAAGGFISEKGNTFWEELVSISFDSQNRAIVGTILIKQVGGYNGNHVVGCWVDWNNNGGYGGGFNNEYVGAGTRYTPNPPSTPVFYGISIPIAPLPGTLGGNYNVKCVMSWMQEISSSSFDPVYGNALIGKIHIDQIY